PLGRSPRSSPFPYTTLFRSVQSQDFLHVGDTEHLTGGDAPRAVARQQQVLLHAAFTLLGTLGLAGQQAEDAVGIAHRGNLGVHQDRKSTRLNSSHVKISYAV